MNASEPVIQAFLDDLLADNPVLATGLGLTAGADRLPSWSAEALARRVAMLRRHEQALLPLLDDDEVATAVDAFAGLQIARRQLRDLELCRVQHRRAAAYLDVLFGLLPLLMRELGSPAQRVEALAGRLRAAPGLLAEARDNREPGLPAALVSAGPDQVDGLLELAGATVRAFAAGAGRAGARRRPRRRRHAARRGARRVAHIPSGGNILVEGWACYCEELMERQGFLAAPAARLMRLNDRVWRACRVVIDIELHLGSWTCPRPSPISAPRRT